MVKEIVNHLFKVTERVKGPRVLVSQFMVLAMHFFSACRSRTLEEFKIRYNNLAQKLNNIKKLIQKILERQYTHIYISV